MFWDHNGIILIEINATKYGVILKELKKGDSELEEGHTHKGNLPAAW